MAPPGVPKDRVEALRKAFVETLQDKEFLQDAEKAKVEILPVSGARIEKLVTDLYATPAPIVAKTAEMLK